MTTTADSGPGSLRQAILDSNVATGGTNTIDFAIPGTGVQTIDTASPLPAITTPLLIDGTTQPGFAGTPLIAVVGQGPGMPIPDRRPGCHAPGAGDRGLRVPGRDGTTISPSSRSRSRRPRAASPRTRSRPPGEELVATVQAAGTTTTLSLLDAQGHVLMQSDGQSPATPPT